MAHRRKREVWHPPEYTKEQHRAVQALAGYANSAVTAEDIPAPSPHEVKRALDWIIHEACGTYEEPFVPGHSDVRDYALGRRSVGLAIIKLINTKVEIRNE